MNSLSSLSDSLLVKLAGTDDPGAEEELISRYKRKAAICARKFYILGGDNEDLIQEAMIGLLKAIRTFDESKGALFGTYAEKCIRTRLIDVISLKRYTAFLSLDESMDFDAEMFCDNDPESLFIKEERGQELTEKIRNSLSEYEKAVLDRYLQGMSCQEIAQDLSKAVSSVYNAVQRIRSKISVLLSHGDSSV